jgi:hypothetical protein
MVAHGALAFGDAAQAGLQITAAALGCGDHPTDSREEIN